MHLSTRLLIAIAVLGFVASDLLSPSGLPRLYAQGSENSAGANADPGGETPAKKKRKKRVKKKRKKPSKTGKTDPLKQPEGSAPAAAGSAETPGAEGGQAAAKTGTGVHATQEGVDEPYSWHMALLSSFGKTERKQGTVKSGHATYNLQLKALYVVGAMFEVGPEIEFFESSAKQDDVTNKSSAWMASIVMVVNFGNVDSDVYVPFLDLKIGSGQDTDKFGDSTTTSSLTQYGLGLGLHWFVDSNVAFTGRMGYSAGTAKSKTKAGGVTTDGGDPVKSTAVDYLDLGFSLFL